MAEQMQDIKRRIKSVNSTQRITGAMKLVSASKLRRSKIKFDDSRELLSRLFFSIGYLLEENEDVKSDFMEEHVESDRTCYILLTSATGLCGGFNATVIKELEHAIEKYDHAKPELITIGSKGEEHFRKRGAEILMSFESTEVMNFDKAKKIARFIMDMYLKKEFDRVYIVYTSYINTMKQVVKRERILPFDHSILDDGQEKSHYSHKVDFKPSPEAVFEYMIDEYIELKLYNACIESATCEHAARRSAMEKASDNAVDMLSALNVHYNRARQAEITNELTEIIAGSQAQIK